MESIEATQILLNYKTKLQQEVLELRKLACDKAAIVRAIEKAISVEDEKELLDFLDVQAAYSLKGIDHLIFNKQ